MDSSSLPKSGHCLLCSSYFVGLKKHFNCYKLKSASVASSKYKCEFCPSEFKVLVQNFMQTT